MPLPPYEKKTYTKTRTIHASWYLSSYNYKFNVTRTREYLKGLRDKKILGLKCRSCNTVSFPPRLICGRCLVKPDQWVLLPETASVSTGSATYDEDDVNREHPYPVLAVRQDGADTVWLSNLPEEYDFKSVYIGMPLKVIWAEETTGTWMDIEKYEPIDDLTKDMNKEEWKKKK